MNTKIIDFCNDYLDALKEKSKKRSSTEEERGTRFFVSVKRNNTRYDATLFELDSDDLDYLYKKYWVRLQGEMNENVKEVEKLYSKFL